MTSSPTQKDKKVCPRCKGKGEGHVGGWIFGNIYECGTCNGSGYVYPEELEDYNELKSYDNDGPSSPSPSKEIKS